MRQKVMIILASQSPRRREILEQVGLEFETVPSGADEAVGEMEPQDMVSTLARRKGEYVAKQIAETGNKDFFQLITAEGTGLLVVAADTLVAMDGRVMGKPADSGEALHMLKSLSGRTHEVYTGVTGILLDSEFVIKSDFHFFERTEVEMYPFSDTEIIDYLSTGEPLDKAGAYGIQGIGARLVKEIRGDYYNVVGFPVAAFLRELTARGLIVY